MKSEAPNRIHVKPASPELRVGIPRRPGQYLPPEGLEVPAASYWYRQAIRGAVEITEAAQREPATAPKPAASRKAARPQKPETLKD